MLHVLSSETPEGIFDMVLRGVIDFESHPWPLISDSAKDLLRKMLCSQPSERFTAHDVLRHPWICGNGVATDCSMHRACQFGFCSECPLLIELLARVQTQEADYLFYIGVTHVQVVGWPLLPPFAEMNITTQASVLKYCPESDDCTEEPLEEDHGEPSWLNTYTARSMRRVVVLCELFIHYWPGIVSRPQYHIRDNYSDDELVD
ncbi:hypothetical protein IFM89_035407 [Coptis chinensis]|uniref:Uncharacterized protein n=1 Tax=Coptis chinensis TaxID=261450 RepID=A0A835HLK8_9MAGN|nr:hypothetical protein IFM89_035407 [Coptis chinensis]